jgi:hypothetical protein
LFILKDRKSAPTGVSPKDRKAEIKNGFRNFAADWPHMAKTLVETDLWIGQPH